MTERTWTADEVDEMIARALAREREKATQQEPVACKTLCELCVKRGYTFCANAVKTTPINTPPQRKPLHIGEETAAFKAWFDAWWIGDGEQGETIPTQSDKHFLTYLDQYTLGFGAWMAAKHAAHGITGEK